MPCPCEKDKTTNADFPIFTADDKPKDPDFHIVVCSKGVAPQAEPLLLALRELTVAKDSRVVVTLVDTSCPAGVWIKGCDVRDIYNAGYLGLPAETSIPRAYNAGAARVRSAKYTVLLHDDVTIPAGDEWLCAFEDALELSAGVVVPHLTGECSNPVQALPTCGAVLHSCEFVSSAALAMRTSDMLAHGLNENMNGRDWWQIEFSVRMAAMTRAALVADCVLDHAGGGTYGDTDTTKAFRANLEVMNKRIGWPLDFNARPRYPRANLARPDSETGKALCVVYDSYWQAAGLDLIGVMRERFDEGGFKQLCVIDTAPSKATRDAILTQFKLGEFYYAADYGGDAISQAISMSDYREVETLDTRPGAGHPKMRPSRLDGKRLRCGDRYDLPQRLNEYRFGCLSNFAVGDTLMMTPAIHAFKAAYPWIRVGVEHSWGAAELLMHNPDIDEVRQYDMNRVTPDSTVVNIGTGNGGERMILDAFKELGLPEPEEVKIQYFVQTEERKAALDWLTAQGVDVDKDRELIGLQTHGTWGYKQNWAHRAELIESLMAEGKTVVEFGTDESKMPDAIPGVVRLFGMPLRQAAAVISLMDCMVTYISGLAFIAAAVGVPVVCNAGPENVEKLLGMCGKNLAWIAKRNPAMCFSERGNSCRALGNNSTCPFRQEGGADCVDDVTAADVLAEINGMPRWGKPISERL